MATTYHDEKRPILYRVSHFTPTSKSHWCWLVLIPCISLSGRQETITGETVDVEPGLTMWSGLPGAPSFGSRSEALRWAELMKLPSVVCDISGR